MKRILLLCLGLLVSLSVWADIDPGPLLNKVTLQLQSEKWITTQTALVYVGVNAAVTDQGIGNVQANVLGKLKQLSDKAEWHVLSFYRQQDQSGLENIRMTAQARLPQSELSGLRNKAKAISKPGETYTIDNVQFVPSDEEIQQANTLLRNDLYMQAKSEIDALNKIYPNQKYYLYSIDFTGYPPSPAPMAMNAMVMEKTMASAPAAPVPVGNKARLTATVVIASMPDVVLQKLGQ
ncbi:hypothetical protein AQUSIP_13910 [Aquicella siphonis]|uniref:DUF541 domain-containing protein n=1 Tax=Aquicella siphonis TaxID=254247 RepID=A0A5E4PIG1_9COXI|nr:hypothetical protein [Aquicella siphonis]VVC76086.1 hypothetical protein AQUSIP_13910 [Aquicella siphonis]